MPYGIGLIFDPLTEARIREVWGRLARQGFATPLTRPGCLPHVSLVLSEALCVEGLAGDLAAWGQDGTPLEVQIATVGVFTTPELVLFYGLTPTAPLLRVHAEVEQIYRRWGSALLARTQSGVWVPHCTLAMRLDIGRLSVAIAAAATWPLPWVATPVRLAVVQFDHRCVETLHICASPC
jgi:2'-5' RNA ligase